MSRSSSLTGDLRYDTEVATNGHGPPADVARRGGLGGALGLFVVVMFVVPSRFTFGPYEPLTAAWAVALLVASLWVAGKLSPTGDLTRGRQGVVTMVLLYFGLMTLSYAWTNAQPLTSQQAQDTMRNLLLLALLTVISLAVADALRSRADIERFLVAAVAAAGVMAVIGILQFTAGVDIARWLKPPGFDANAVDSFISSRGGLPRVMSTARHPIEFAVLCAAMIPPGIYLAMHGRTPGTRQMAGLSTLALALAMPMGFSRTGMAALGVIAILLVPLVPGRVWVRAAAFGVLLVVVVASAFPQIVTGFDDLRTGVTGTGSVVGRAEHREEALQLASESPWIGHGFGTQNKSVRGYVIDNTYIELLVETGWIGIAAFVGLFLVAIFTAIGVRRHARDPAMRDLAGLLAASLAGIAVAGWGLHILRFNSAAALMFLLLGLVAAVARELARGRGAATARSPVPMIGSASSRPSETSDAHAPGVAEPLPARDVVFTFFIETWNGAVRRGMARPPDRLIQTLLVHPSVERVLVANASRGVVSRAARRLGLRGGLEPFPSDEHARLVAPLRARLRHPRTERAIARSYRSYDAWVRRAASRFGVQRPAFITTNPFVAAYSPLDWVHSITYYARDDWAAHHDHAALHDALRAAYREIGHRGVRVAAVSQELLDRIAPTGEGRVTPNGIAPGEWLDPDAPPPWFQSLPRPRVTYTGVLDSRLDVDALGEIARHLADGSVVLVGEQRHPAHLRPLRDLPNVHWAGRVSRGEVAAIVRDSDACMLPHRRTALTEAMSPLKLYEYLAAGRPVVASDLPPVRGVDPHVVVAAEGRFVDGVSQALRLGPMDETARRAFIRANAWANRHETILELALR